MSDKLVEGIAKLAQARADDLWRFAYTLMGDAHDAEDLLQQAFAVALRKASAAPRGRLWQWLVNVVYGEALNMRRARQRRFERETLHSAQHRGRSEDDPAVSLAMEESSAKLRALVLKLDAPERDALTLTAFGGLSHREAANALGIALGTLKSNVRRGMQQLRTELGEGEHEFTRRLLALTFPIASGHGSSQLLISTLLSNAGLTGGGAAAASVAAGGVAVSKKIAFAVVLIVLAIGGVSVATIDWGSADDTDTSQRNEDTEPDYSAGDSPQSLGTTERDQNTAAQRDRDDATTAARKDSEPEETSATSEESAPADEVIEGEAFSCQLSGRVTTFGGTPVAEATVKALLPEGGDTLLPRTLQGATTTDSNGNFMLQVEGIWEEGHDRARLSIEASADGYANARSMRLIVQRDSHIKGVNLSLPTGSSSIYGRVLSDTTGEPLSGISVSLSGEREFRGGLNLTMSGVSSQSANYSIPSVTTNENGIYRFSNLPPGRYDMAASRKGATSDESLLGGPLKQSAKLPSRPRARETRLRLGEGVELGPITLRLEAPGPLTFQISNDDVEGVYVNFPRGRMAAPVPRGLGSWLTSDGSGTYSIDWVSSQRNQLSIQHPRYAPMVITLGAKRFTGGDLGVLTLERGLELSGTVKDESGAPVAGAEVILRMPDGQGGWATRNGWQEPDHLKLVRTDEKGTFVLPGLGVGSFAVVARTETSIEYTRNLRVTESTSELEPLEITLREGGSINGYVRLRLEAGGYRQSEDMMTADMVALAPMSGQRVASTGALDAGMLGYLAGSARWRFDINPDGSYRGDRITPGSYLAIAFYNYQPSYVKNVEIKTATTTEVDFTKGLPGGTVSGYLTRSGKPLPYSGVRLSYAPDDNGRVRMGGAYSVTTINGFFRFEGVVPGRYVVIAPEEDVRTLGDALDVRVAEVLSDGDDVRVDIDLPGQRATVSGTVLLGGMPLVESISLAPKSGRTRDDPHAPVNPDGSYELYDIEPGEYWVSLQVAAPNMPFQSAHRELRIGEEESNIHFSEDLALASFSGRVLGPDGQPLSGLDVAIRLLPWKFSSKAGKEVPSESFNRAYASGSGHFDFPYLIAGRFDVIIDAPGFESLRETIAVSGAVVRNLQLTSQAGALEVILLKRPPSSSVYLTATVRLEPSSGGEAIERPWLNFSTDTSWSRMLHGIPAGGYNLVITGNDFETQRIEGVVIVAGESAQVQLSLENPSGHRVLVSNPELNASDVMSAKLRLQDGEGNSIALPPRTQPKGPSTYLSRQLKLVPLEPGAYVLTIVIPGYLPYRHAFEVEANDIENSSVTMARAE